MKIVIVYNYIIYGLFVSNSNGIKWFKIKSQHTENNYKPGILYTYGKILADEDDPINRQTKDDDAQSVPKRVHLNANVTFAETGKVLKRVKMVKQRCQNLFTILLKDNHRKQDGIPPKIWFLDVKFINIHDEYSWQTQTHIQHTPMRVWKIWQYS